MKTITFPPGQYQVHVLRDGIILLPCPFCAGEGSESWGTTNHGAERVYYIECLSCAAMGPEANTAIEAVENWNIRITKVGSPPPSPYETEGDIEC